MIWWIRVFSFLCFCFFLSFVSVTVWRRPSIKKTYVKKPPRLLPPPQTMPVTVSVTMPTAQPWVPPPPTPMILGTYDDPHASKGERLTGRAIQELYPHELCYVNYRPDFFKNPKTGRNFEFDFYLPNRGWGIQVHGEQHYVKTNLHKTDREFEAQLERDQKKRELCDQLGIKQTELDSRLYYTKESIKEFLKSEEPS